MDSTNMRSTPLMGVLVVILAALASCTAAEDAGSPQSTVQVSSTTTNAETTTTAPGATSTSLANDAFDGITVAMQAIDAWNSGDFDAWLAFWEPAHEQDLLFSQSVMNSHEQIEVVASCQRDSEAGTVTCPVRVRDDFHGPGGLTSDGSMEFSFSQSGLIVDTAQTTYQDENGDCCPEWQAYHTAFHGWLREAHPDVYEEIGPKNGSPLWYLPGYASGDADHMLIALEYVDEFISQSLDYPLG